MHALWQSKVPHKTRWLVLCPSTRAEYATVEQLKTMGWQQGPQRLSVLATYLDKPGSDIFNSWTAAEAKANIKEVEAVLGKLPHQKMTLVDLL